MQMTNNYTINQHNYWQSKKTRNVNLAGLAQLATVLTCKRSIEQMGIDVSAWAHNFSTSTSTTTYDLWTDPDYVVWRHDLGAG